MMMKTIQPNTQPELQSWRIIRFLIQKAAEFESKHLYKFGNIYRRKAQSISRQLKETI